MSEVVIPTRHQSAPQGEPPHAKQSLLRELHNRVIGIRHHQGAPVKEGNVLTDSFVLGLSQAILEEARDTRAGHFLLELLGAVSYAGNQGRPLMLIGKKIKAGGFHLKVVIPIDTQKRPGTPPSVSSENGVQRFS